MDSVTLVVSEGEMVSSGSSTISPASSTDLTSVNLVPRTVRDLPLILTVTYDVPSTAPRWPLRETSLDASVAENEVSDAWDDEES